MNHTQHDPLSDFFASEWAASPPAGADVSSSAFAAAVLRKIAVRRRRERLFTIAYIAVAVAGVAAVALFVYPGYKTIGADTAPFVRTFVRETAQSLAEQFRSLTDSVTELRQSADDPFKVLSGAETAPSIISLPLLAYLVLLVAAFWSLDLFIRRRVHR